MRKRRTQCHTSLSTSQLGRLSLYNNKNKQAVVISKDDKLIT